MTNHFKFHCPVTGADALLTDCEDVHSKSMKGQADRIENKVCGLAHQCWMCPARNAFRVGGPWARVSDKPRIEKPMEKAAKLPADLVSYSLSHTLPNHADYRRVGLRGDDVGCHDDLFRELHRKIGKTLAAESAPKKRKKTLMDGLKHDKDHLAKGLTAAVRQERAQSASGASGRDDAQKRANAPRARSEKSQGASAAPQMSLAARAKQMRERRQQT